MLRIEGYVDDGQPFLDALCFCSQMKRLEPIKLLLDTGCDKTSLFPYDVHRLGIDCSGLSLNKIPTSGVGGNVGQLPFLPEFFLFFVATKGRILKQQILTPESFESVDIFEPSKHNVPYHFSVLGVDFINKYTFRYCHGKRKVCLEK